MPPAPLQGQGGVGIEVRVRPPLAPGSANAAERAYFVRLDEGDESKDGALYPSNFHRDGRVYLLNAEPGRYAVVAVGFRVQVLATESSYYVYFPGALIDATETVVEAGALAHAGRHDIDSASGVCPEDADAAQLRYAERIAPGVPKCGVLRLLLHQLAANPVVVFNGQVFSMGPSVHHLRGVPRESVRDDRAKQEFLHHAAEDLAATGWTQAGTR